MYIFFWQALTYIPCFAVNAQAVVKGTSVDGVYDCNSRDNNFTFEHISFRELLSRGFNAMDLSALTVCEENAIPGMYVAFGLFYGCVSGRGALGNSCVDNTYALPFISVPFSGFRSAR